MGNLCVCLCMHVHTLVCVCLRERETNIGHDCELVRVINFQARRSLVFAKHLRQIGDEFRKTELNSTDEQDGTITEDDWTKMRVCLVSTS